MSRHSREIAKLLTFWECAHETLARVSNVVQRVTVAGRSVMVADVIDAALKEYKRLKEMEIHQRWGTPDER